MPLLFLDSTSWPQVRALLDLSLDAASLPDATIQQPVFAYAAEGELIERDPLALTYVMGSDARQRAINAAIYLTAARLAPSLPAISQEKLGDWQMSQTPPDLVKLVASLRAMASSEIAQNVTGASAAPLPAFWIARAPCRRGWSG